MAVFIGSFVLNVSDLGRAVEFWTKATGYLSQRDDPAFLVPPSGNGPLLHLDDKDRTHVDLWLDRQESDLESEVARLITLGARRVEWHYPEGADFVVLADTEGNLFCIVA